MTFEINSQYYLTRAKPAMAPLIVKEVNQAYGAGNIHWKLKPEYEGSKESDFRILKKNLG